ncbi:universal stress protein Sll1388-like [Ruditapes philippinarum]|uniref:universal stress protein Sll1388-like n=1 Tax=Ruditapes philippinarum TaxID=129788 RepID=UPI00295BE7BB|nr:universal stress protein Sll1388-like [Ruditapes philippinarum]
MSGGSRSVLVCIDASEFAERAFEYYVQNVWRQGDNVILGYIPEFYNFEFASPRVIEQLLKEESDKCNKVEEKYKQKMTEHNLSGKFKTDRGKPGDALCKMAQDEGATLIVIGSRGLGKVRRTLIGSVSSDVLHHAHVPVLVCK